MISEAIEDVCQAEQSVDRLETMMWTIARSANAGKQQAADER
jgi:hypothetical protein